MSADFTQFAEAIAANTAEPSRAKALDVNRVSVLGGGVDARLLAALCLANEAEVTLFSAYGSELGEIANGITIRGDGPIGTYQVNPGGGSSIRVTAEIDRAVSNADVIFLTGPIHKQRTYAMVLADHLCDGQVIVLPNAKTLGALETARLLRVGGASAEITIVEMQGLPFWAAQQGSTLNLAACNPQPAATLPSGRSGALDALAALIGPVLPTTNVVQSSLMDFSSVVEYPVLCLGGAAVEAGGPRIVSGGVPLETNRTFRNQIGPQHELLIDALACERRTVAAAYGVRNMPDSNTVIERIAGQASGMGARPVCVQSEAINALRDIAIGSLLPLLSLGDVAGVQTPITQSAVSTISAILATDVRSAGRSLNGIGIAATELDDVRRQLEAAAKGAT